MNRSDVALQMVVLRVGSSRPENFAAVHARGAWGRKLSLRVADIMISNAYPWLAERASIEDTIVSLAAVEAGC